MSHLAVRKIKHDVLSRGSARSDTTLDQKEQPMEQDFELAGVALEIANQFQHLKTNKNRPFFNALVKHFANYAYSSCIPLHFEYALTCNDRGHTCANFLRRYTRLRGKRFLDIGCAYGGFLVAFAEQGSEVIGIDIDERLLQLARQNLSVHGIDAPLLLKDATHADDLKELQDQFDIIVCNDVVEHVHDIRGLLQNIATMLSRDGIVYFEIPNGQYIRYVMQDGHHQLFGITLLDYSDAQEYFSFCNPTGIYDTFNYLQISDYTALFEQAGMTLTILEENFLHIDLEGVLRDVGKLRNHTKSFLAEVPLPVRDRVAIRLDQYLKEVESMPRKSQVERRDFLVLYGMENWKILAHKK